MAEEIEVPPVRVAKYQPEGFPPQILIFDEAGKLTGKVMFEDSPSGQELANEYYVLKCTALGVEQ